jgi:hypothetical protein
LNLAHFLCTTPKVPDGPNTHPPSLATIPFPTRQPQHAALAADLPTLYYRPAKLLATQKDTLDKQAKDAEALVDADKAAWSAEAKKLDAELAELKEKRDKGLEDLERDDRAERAERERMQRDAADAEATNSATPHDDAPEDVHMKDPAEL